MPHGARVLLVVWFVGCAAADTSGDRDKDGVSGDTDSAPVDTPSTGDTAPKDSADSGDSANVDSGDTSQPVADGIAPARLVVITHVLQ
ncbi:MAG: hypothetical protein H6732_20380 [Alphaproteobacteria bacterium]|nr:hypothetical protein [Alphaproteobacteria bacterium]